MPVSESPPGARSGSPGDTVPRSTARVLIALLAVLATVPATLGSAAEGLSPRSARDVAGPGSQLREDRIEALDHRRLAPDHQAIPSLPSPDTAAGPDVHIVDALLGEIVCAPDVVDVIGITAVDEGVAGCEMGQ